MEGRRKRGDDLDDIEQELDEPVPPKDQTTTDEAVRRVCETVGAVLGAQDWCPVPALVAAALLRVVSQLLRTANKLEHNGSSAVEQSGAMVTSVAFLDRLLGADACLPVAPVYAFVRELVSWNHFADVAEPVMRVVFAHVQLVSSSFPALKLCADISPHCPAAMLPGHGRLPIGKTVAKQLLAKLKDIDTVPGHEVWLMLRVLETVEVTVPTPAVKMASGLWGRFRAGVAEAALAAPEKVVEEDRALRAASLRTYAALIRDYSPGAFADLLPEAFAMCSAVTTPCCALSLKAVADCVDFAVRAGKPELVQDALTDGVTGALVRLVSCQKA
jgi:hypothetical protein